MNITFLGSTARELESRNSVSFIVEDENSTLLIDCGPGFISGMNKANKKTSDINHILLTHVHGDHIASFPYFVWYRNIERFRMNPPKDLNVYGQKDALELAKYNLEHMYPEIKWPFKIIYHEVSEESSFTCDTLKVRVFNAIHSVPCLGCVIESDEKKVAYSGDSLPNEELLRYAKDADFLIHDVILMKDKLELAEKTMHTTSESAGQIANKANAKILALVHIEPQVFGQEKEIITEASKEYSGLVTIPTEGTVYHI